MSDFKSKLLTFEFFYVNYRFFVGSGLLWAIQKQQVTFECFVHQCQCFLKENVHSPCFPTRSVIFSKSRSGSRGSKNDKDIL